MSLHVSIHQKKKHGIENFDDCRINIDRVDMNGNGNSIWVERRGDLRGEIVPRADEREKKEKRGREFSFRKKKELENLFKNFQRVN